MSEEKKTVTYKLPRLRVSPAHPLIKEAEAKIIGGELSETYSNLKISGITNKHLQLKQSSIPNAGMGVFAAEDIVVDDAIEFCHSIVLDNRSRYTFDKKLTQYGYMAPCSCQSCKEHGNQVMLPLGFGMIYNSAESKEKANCEYFTIPEEKLVVFIASDNIKAGEEILTWWGEGYYNAWCRPKETKTEEHNEEQKTK